MSKNDVVVETKYADGSTQVRKGGKVISAKAKATAPVGEIAKVEKVASKNGTVAVEYPEAKAPSTSSGQAEPIVAYCMKCKAKVEMVGPKKTVVSGKNAFSGTCPDCETKVFKFAGGGREPVSRAKSEKSRKAEPKAKTNGKKADIILSPKAQAAYEKISAAGQLADCWCGTTTDGISAWWEGNEEDGWTLCHDPIVGSQQEAFKKLLVKSL